MEKRIATEGRNGSVTVSVGGKRFRSPPGTRIGQGSVKVGRKGGRLVVVQGKVKETFVYAMRGE